MQEGRVEAVGRQEQRARVCRRKVGNMSIEYCLCLLPTGGEEKEVLGDGSILPSCQDMKTVAL